MLNNSRNEHGVKDQGDCYRNGGKMIQWMDEGADYIDVDGGSKFWNTVARVKASGVKYRITTISDGKRLFIDESRSDEL